MGPQLWRMSIQSKRTDAREVYSRSTHLLQLEHLVEVVLEGEEAVGEEGTRWQHRQHEAHLDKRGQRMPGQY